MNVPWDWIFLGAKTLVRPEVPAILEIRAPRNYGEEAAARYVRERVSELDTEGKGIPLIADVVELHVLAWSADLGQVYWQGTYTDLDRWSVDLEQNVGRREKDRGFPPQVMLAGLHIESILIMIADKLRRLGCPWSPEWWFKPARKVEAWDPLAYLVKKPTMIAASTLARLVMPESPDHAPHAGTWTNPELDAQLTFRLASSFGLLGAWRPEAALGEVAPVEIDDVGER